MTPAAPLPAGACGQEWSSALLDLPAYLERIGCAGTWSPCAATLRALHRAHVLSIPFENLDIALGRPIALKLTAIQAKLVTRRRGGYCFEHNLLFAAALERIGFSVRRLGGRVRLGSSAIRPRTHMVLTVEADGCTWLADVGFGCNGPLEAIRLNDGEVATQSGWRYALTRETPEEWVLRAHSRDGWSDLYAFTLADQRAVDYAMANHYVATHERSPFVRGLIVQATDARARWALRHRMLVETRIDAADRSFAIPERSLGRLLRDHFALDLTEAEVHGLAAVPAHATRDVDAAAHAG